MIRTILILLLLLLRRQRIGLKPELLRNSQIVTDRARE